MRTASDRNLGPRSRQPLKRLVASPRDAALAGIAIASLLLFLACFTLYLRFSFAIYPTLSFNSDDSAWLLYASEILKQHSLFPHWYNSTAIQFPLTEPKLLLLPALLAISNHWMASFRGSVAVDQLLMSLLLWWILGRVEVSRSLRLFLLCFLFASVSPQMAEQTVMIAGQDWFYAEMLLLSYLVYRCLQFQSLQEWAANWSHYAWLGGVATVLFIDRSNISQMLPPLIAGVFVLWVIRFNRQPSRVAAATLAVLGLSAVAGDLIYRFLLPHSVSYQPIAPSFVDMNAVGANLQLLIRGLLDLFGATPVAGKRIYSIATVWWAAKLGLLCLVLLGPLWLLTQWGGLKSDFIRLLVVVFIVSLAMRVLVYLFTGISVGAIQTNRYFISVSLLGLTVMLLYFEQRWWKLPTYSGAFVLAVIVALASPLAVARPVAQSEHQQIVRFLEQHHLQHGYATFWNAGVLTALSGDRVQVRQIILGSGDIRPYEWLSSEHWYRGDPNVHHSFLLLKGAERKFNLGPLEPVLGKPTRIENYGDYRALVYPFDIAQRLAWSLSMQGRLRPADRRADIENVDSPVWSEEDHRWMIKLRVTNLGSQPIGSNGRSPVNLGVHLFSHTGKQLDHDYARATLPMIAPHQSATLIFEAPDNRASANVLEFDLVQENVAWFGGSGNHTLRIEIPPVPSSSAE